ncbi:Deoxyguanosinetriphosphate triphosphohydrolase-like protein [Moorella thermoacetica]|uniref:Deoxyguanosinetriphosphate triphosphohydrolase-like protein n=2 Tax=Neomoorella thermoacetica TaxID=1525 RepID=A0AAC9HG54_NEOTH|nr:HD domain-containing protein [Moorella thermoacetica]AOQ23322.1 deoxyguanosinetriphosphate triphosphohydrolase-like protein [Moorella thermoacetica]TYL13030.1 Deoxyguanosinetriphosphate triphosphohydrolase-like protein [Moorella thermoacetica]
MKFYEIRDPIFGFITINEWEREIIDHWAFQRLRRIKQLAWTDMVYPGATHSRFEHSLGVMHIATQMFDAIVHKNAEFLKSEMNFTDAGFQRDRVLVRLASLLHDVGHAPFSHSGEEVMPKNPATDKPYKHEAYSEATIRYLMKDVIENHPLNQNYHIKADDVADFLAGKPSVQRSLLWRGLITSQLDADRADYLLRDSHHIGVEYGKYDLKRLLVTLTVAYDENGEPVLAVEEGGWHAAEGLILARYMMFTQVYFQHTRRAYDYHIARVMHHLLKESQPCTDSQRGKFPAPTSAENVKLYLQWNDWLVYGLIHSGQGGPDAEIIRKRRHHRSIYQTSEVPTVEELNLLEEISDELGEIVCFVDEAESSWYKFGREDISILPEENKGRNRKTNQLSAISSVVKGLNPIKQRRIYVPLERKKEAEDKLKKYLGGV